MADPDDTEVLQPTPDEVVERIRRAVGADDSRGLSDFHWQGAPTTALLDGYRAVHAAVTAWAGPPASDDGEAGGSPASSWTVDDRRVELYAHVSHLSAVLQVAVGPVGG